MISTYKYQGVSWVDLESPTEEELIHIMDEYHVPEIMFRELLSETLLSKVDIFDQMIYLILHFPRIHNEQKMPDLELDFIIGKDFLITVHYEFSNAIHDFAKTLEVESMLSRPLPSGNAGFVFIALISEAYRQAGNKLGDLYHMLEDVKVKIFNGHEENVVEELSLINRKILDFRQALRFHGSILESFEKVSIKLFGPEFAPYVQGVHGEYFKITGVLEGHRDMLLDLRATNDSLLSAKTSHTMRVLTIMSFTTFPLALIATIVSMVTDVHIINTPIQFVYVVSAIVLLGILMILFFKHKRWL